MCSDNQVQRMDEALDVQEACMQLKGVMHRL